MSPGNPGCSSPIISLFVLVLFRPIWSPLIRELKTTQPKDSLPDRFLELPQAAVMMRFWLLPILAGFMST